MTRKYRVIDGPTEQVPEEFLMAGWTVRRRIIEDTVEANGTNFDRAFVYAVCDAGSRRKQPKRSCA